MGTKEVRASRRTLWLEDQNDPDNWIRIPEFGVLPMAVAFEGFAFPIVQPNARNYAFNLSVRVAVKTIRELVQLDLKSLIDVSARCLEVLDLLDLHGWDGPPIEVTQAQRSAAMYSINMKSIEMLNRSDDRPFEYQLLLLADIFDNIREWVMQRHHAANQATVSFSKRQKAMLSEAGLKGAKVRNALSTELKVWGIVEGNKLKGLPAAKARELMKCLPVALAQKIKEAGDKLKDPERVIRDALVNQRKVSNTASEPKVADS